MAFKMVQPQLMPFTKIRLNLYRFIKKREEKNSREEDDTTVYENFS